jgi:4-hydroxymandelate oxidase
MSPQPLNLFDYEPLARARLDAGAYGYYASGANDEITLRDNRAAYDRLRLAPRMLVCPGAPDMRTTLFGRALSAPFGIAPMGYMRYAHPDAETAVARAAAARGISLTLSTVSTVSLEDIAQTGVPRLFQLYLFNRESGEELVRRAEAAGYSAIVLTVDSPQLGRRETGLRAGTSPLADGLDLPNLSRTAAFARWQARTGGSPMAYAGMENRTQATWADVAWLRATTTLPIVLKGILRGDDAARALDYGVDGIIVSNHGGRQLDTCAATIDALPGVVAAVNGRVPVLVDGGVRRGTDIVKALALGAAAALVGRPILWALAVDGEAGVGHALDLLHDELVLALLLCGCESLAAVTPDLIFR